ncbi:MAG: single-stranded-DNA-specific exonuclease C-terminal domain-containing protein, partial [Bacillota bacterium]|nr:single-stranded-DNA-specific exonuclease C-terminal domain-containing protein [Bacillota bacterium]
VVPLVGENRSLVKTGLKLIETTWRPGLRSLIEEAGLWGQEINTTHVGYMLAPRINAAGRIGNPLMALELLLTEDSSKAASIAKLLNDENVKRQEIELEILQDAEELIKEQVNFDRDRVIVLASEKWHSGVIGIVASKIVEKYYRPTILVAIEDNVGKGSGRSISGFDLHQALTLSNQHLERYGGHQQAAGLSILKENIDEFREKINEIAAGILSDEDLSPLIKIDSEISLQEISMNLVNELELLAPFGVGNPRPTMECTNINITSWSKVGKEQNHLKITASQADAFREGIGFNLGQYDKLVAATESLSLAFGIEKNSWQGKEEVQLILKDIKPYYFPETKLTTLQEFALQDAREIKDRIAYLQKFVGANNLIYVYSHEEKQELQKRHNGNGWDYFVANGQITENKIYDHVFLYQTPLHLEDLKYLAPVSKKLHLLYSDLPEEHVAKTKFPDRELIGGVYKILKGMVGNNKKSFAARELFAAIYYKIRIGPEESMIILDILTELKLVAITKYPETNMYQLSLLQEPEEKLDLYNSQTYNKIMSQMGRYIYWACFWLFTSKAELQKKLFFSGE